jgi:hypothetical protein
MFFKSLNDEDWWVLLCTRSVPNQLINNNQRIEEHSCKKCAGQFLSMRVAVTGLTDCLSTEKRLTFGM